MLDAAHGQFATVLKYVAGKLGKDELLQGYRGFQNPDAPYDMRQSRKSDLNLVIPLDQQTLKTFFPI
jgi:hypothetical protein